MDRETNDLIARWYLSQRNVENVEPREFADWALFEVEKGHDLKYLKMLASQFDSKSISEVEEHFRKSISELGWVFPDEETATKRYAESIMKQILNGSIPPYEGCRRLYMMCIYLGYPDYLYNWNAFFWAREDISDDELNELIVDEARSRLAGEPTERIHEVFMYRGESEQSSSFWARLKKSLKR